MSKQSELNQTFHIIIEKMINVPTNYRLTIDSAKIGADVRVPRGYPNLLESAMQGSCRKMPMQSLRRGMIPLWGPTIFS
jgi:hypothetical protein